MKKEGKDSQRVVAHLRNHKLVKGYTDALPASDLASLGEQEQVGLPAKIDVRLVETQETISLTLKSLKALFFVKSFEGSKEYEEIKFFAPNPPIEGLWLWLKFFDNERIEGVVRNSLQYLIDPGFFLKPPDPESNNELIYVVKASLIEFRVQGVSATY